MLDKEIEDDSSTRNMDLGQLNKRNNSLLYDLEHRARRKER
jgi:hypothetical protein